MRTDGKFDSASATIDLGIDKIAKPLHAFIYYFSEAIDIVRVL